MILNSGSSTEDELSKLTMEASLPLSHPAFQVLVTNLNFLVENHLFLKGNPATALLLLGHQWQSCLLTSDCPHLLAPGLLSFASIFSLLSQMPPQAVSHALEFLYTGRIHNRTGLHLPSIEQVSSVLSYSPSKKTAGGKTAGAADPCQVPEQPEEERGIPQLWSHNSSTAKVAKNFYWNWFLYQQMIETIGRQLEDVVLGQRLFSDIEVNGHISFPFPA